MKIFGIGLSKTGTTSLAHAESMPGVNQGAHTCMEWQSAAAHAVAGAVGKSIRACNSGGELTYNKPDWSSECVTVS